MRYILSPITYDILHRVTVFTVFISQLVLCSYGITLQLKQKCFLILAFRLASDRIPKFHIKSRHFEWNLYVQIESPNLC